METHELRALFRVFAGADRYRKFVRAVSHTCRDKNRLLFWQEQLWNDFAASLANPSFAGEDIIRAFSVCDVHDCELQAHPIDEAFSEVRDTLEYERACDASFPFATARDRICPRCCTERTKWIEENADLCRIMRCKTTYEEYCKRWFEGLIDKSSRVTEKVKQRSAEIAAEMQPGDELWEWDAGGWHRLAGRAGVAIVRAGRVVKQWCEWRS
ncbi:MAG: hypothetical protein U0793_09980 [Gemmataceae bacterium]